ncbi:MAG: hypothetical protein QE487_15125 [Fluviicola sp.]|nr:hypothetical protein [Fluviicola sp.]
MQIPSCEKVNDYGMAYNSFRKKLGVPLKKEMVNNILSTSDDNTEGFSLFRLPPSLEKVNQSNHRPYYLSKSIYFSAKKITEELDSYYYSFDDSSTWHMSSVTNYISKEVEGYVVIIRNEHYIDSTKISINQQQRDSVLHSWGLR